jgi:hypothetical protein
VAGEHDARAPGRRQKRAPDDAEIERAAEPGYAVQRAAALGPPTAPDVGDALTQGRLIHPQQPKDLTLAVARQNQQGAVPRTTPGPPHFGRCARPSIRCAARGSACEQQYAHRTRRACEVHRRTTGDWPRRRGPPCRPQPPQARPSEKGPLLPAAYGRLAEPPAKVGRICLAACCSPHSPRFSVILGRARQGPGFTGVASARPYHGAAEEVRAQRLAPFLDPSRRHARRKRWLI